MYRNSTSFVFELIPHMQHDVMDDILWFNINKNKYIVVAMKISHTT